MEEVYKLGALLLGVTGAAGTLWSRISKGDAKLHDRIDDMNKKIDRVKETHVRRDDLDVHLAPLKTQMSDLKRDMHESIKTLNKISTDLAAGLRK